MNAKSLLVGLVGVGFVTVLASACGSSSGGTTGDGGTKDSATKDSGVDAPKDTGNGTCTGLDAAAAMIMYSQACAVCVTANCCSQAQKCAGDPICIGVVKCQLGCIHDGGAPLSCAMTCVDAVDSGTSKATATFFDECLQGSCSSTCTTM